MSMTLFVILSLALAAATLAILAWRGPAVAHVTDPAGAAEAAARPTRGLVIGLTLLVAVGRNSERIAFLALVGGLITPMLVSTGENHEAALFTYLTILGAGVLGIAWVRDWKSLPPAQFLATLVYFW